MNIQSTRRTPIAVPPSSTHTDKANKSQAEGSAPMETFTWAANGVGDFTLKAATALASVATVSGVVYEITGQEALAVGVGLVAGGAIGLTAGSGLVNGLDALGGKLDKNKPQRGALLLKTAALGVAGTVVAGCVADINKGLNVMRTFSAIGNI